MTHSIPPLPTRRAVLAAVLATALGVTTPLLAGGTALASQTAAPGTHQFSVTTRTAAADDAARLKLAIAPGTDLQPTKLYLPPNQKLRVTVSGVGNSDPNGRPSIAIGAPATQLDPDADPDAGFGNRVLQPRITALKAGATTVTDRHGGVVYLRYPARAATPSTAKVSLSAAAVPIATFTLGETTERDFQRQLDQRTAPFVELYAKRAVLTFPRSQALLYRGENHAALLRTLDQIIGVEDRLSGYHRSSENTGPAGPHHLVGYPGAIAGVGAYATTSFTAYPPPIQRNLLTVRGLRLAGWGPYHELGHQHQLSPVNPEGLVEVTVNIYSLAAQRYLAQYGAVPRLRATNDNGKSHWDDTMAVLDQGVESFDELGPFAKVIPFEQLRLGYGEKVLTRWHDVVRQQDLPAGDDAQRWQNVIFTTSVAAGADLSEFWDRWGVEVTAATKAKIADLGLRKPTINLIELRETTVPERYTERV